MGALFIFSHNKRFFLFSQAVGFLYASGSDKAVVTRSDSTVAAVRAAIRVLRPGGVLTVVGYTGHEGGWEEVEAVMSVVSDLDPREFTAGASLHTTTVKA